MAALAAALLATSPAPALVGGTEDAAGEHAAVLVLVAEPRARCSATKIGPRELLTAGHCVVDLGTGELRGAYAPGGALRIGNGVVPGASALRAVQVEATLLAPAFRDGLDRFMAYKRERIAALRGRLEGTELMGRILALEARHNFTARFPDAALVRLRAPLPDIPSLRLDLSPLAAEDPVTLVGYGCADFDSGGAQQARHPFGIRRWAETRVIRADPVNFYSYARHLRPGAPSLCPGDSGGPVLRHGRVVGVHGTVYGVGGRAGERGGHSNMAVHLHGLRDWTDLVEAASAPATGFDRRSPAIRQGHRRPADSDLARCLGKLSLRPASLPGLPTVSCRSFPPLSEYR